MSCQLQLSGVLNVYAVFNQPKLSAVQNVLSSGLKL